MAGGSNARHFSVDDLGAVVIVITCLILIGLGKETATVTTVLLTITGFMFGKYTRKAGR